MLAFGDYMSATCHACIGGKSIGEDMRMLGAGVQIVSVSSVSTTLSAWSSDSSVACLPRCRARPVVSTT